MNCKKESIYRDRNSSILKFLNSSLQESFGLDPAMIVTAFF